MKNKSASLFLIWCSALAGPAHGTVDENNQAPIFNCSLNGRLPPVKIIGTNHDDEEQHTDDMLIQASKGKYYLGFEGLPFGEEYNYRRDSPSIAGKVDKNGIKKFVFGLEDNEDAVDIMELFIKLNEMCAWKKEDDAFSSKLEFDIFLLTRSLTRKVLSNLSFEDLMSLDKKMRDRVLFLSSLVASLDLEAEEQPEDFFTSMKEHGYLKIASESKSPPCTEFTKLAQMVFRAWRKEYADKYPEYAMDVAEKAFSDPRNELDGLLFYKYHLHFRDRVFAKNLGRAYCKHYKARKEFRLSVGHSHLEGLKSLIDKHSGGQISVETVDLALDHPNRALIDAMTAFVQ